MPSSRKHPRRYPNDAADTAHTCKTALVADAPHTEGGDFIDQTITIWQKRTERKLTREDGREIVENISGFFSILQEWEQRERATECARMALLSDSKVGRCTQLNEVDTEIGLSSNPVRAKYQA